MKTETTEEKELDGDNKSTGIFLSNHQNQAAIGAKESTKAMWSAFRAASLEEKEVLEPIDTTPQQVESLNLCEAKAHEAIDNEFSIERME